MLPWSVVLQGCEHESGEVQVVVVVLLLLLPANECQTARQQKLWKHCRRFAKSRRRGEAYPTRVKKGEGWIRCRDCGQKCFRCTAISCSLAVTCIDLFGWLHIFCAGLFE